MAGMIRSRNSGNSRIFGSSSGSNLSPIPSTSTRNSSGTSTSSGRKNSISDSVTNYLESKNIDMKYMTPEALGALNQLIASGGINPLIAKQDAEKENQIRRLKDILGTIESTNPEEIAFGRTQELGRNLRESVLPQLFGSAETSGIGGNALTNLLAQDAAIRTAEASSRVEEEVRSNLQQEAIQVSEVLNALLDSGSNAMDSLLQALNTSKGAIQTGTENTSGTKRTSTVGTESTSSSTTSNETATTESVDPLAWAQLEATLQELSQNKGPSAAEKLIAAFNASKGPFMNLTNINTSGSEEQELLKALRSLGL